MVSLNNVAAAVAPVIEPGSKSKSACDIACSPFMEIASPTNAQFAPRVTVVPSGLTSDPPVISPAASKLKVKLLVIVVVPSFHVLLPVSISVPSRFLILLDSLEEVTTPSTFIVFEPPKWFQLASM